MREGNMPEKGGKSCFAWHRHQQWNECLTPSTGAQVFWLGYFFCRRDFLKCMRDHLWGTKKLLFCWNSGLMVGTSQLVKSQSSGYLMSRSSKAKKKEEETLVLKAVVPFRHGRLWIFFFRDVCWPRHSSDVCHCLRAHGEGSNRESFYISLGRGILMWPDNQVLAFTPLAPRGNANQSDGVSWHPGNLPAMVPKYLGN